ncbi:MAG: type II/IV secretion system protein [Candidatus Coatesbacteria bacterium]|nr:type II/IV secretion system protein [Candidatus Coatesbacteria bacterium]
MTPSSPQARFGSTLIENGVIDQETLDKALQIQGMEVDSNRRKLGEILVSDLGIDRDKVYREIANIYAFRTEELTEDDLEEDRIRFISDVMEGVSGEMRGYLLNKKVLPYKLHSVKHGVLIVVCPDPTDREVQSLATEFGYRRYEIAYMRVEDIVTLASKLVPEEEEFLKLIEQANDAVETIEDTDTEFDEEALEAEINKSLLTNLVEGCLVEAVRKGASDIHVIPKPGNITEFYFRVDGKLQLWYRHEGTKPEAISAVIKDRSKNVDRFEWDAAQDGFIQRTIDNYLMRFRVSIMPIVGQELRRKLESIVIRVIDDRKLITDFEDLGFQKKAREDFIKAIGKPQGIVILTGPTGSGKSTTLVAALSHVMNPSINVVTVEDPVEYNIPGARQIKLGPRLDFDLAIRSILRHDPDVVMVGEMRDKTTAEIAVKMANTGHLTFTTLHTNDAISAVARLYKMGIEPFLLAYSINIVVAQRLVRTLCKECKRPITDLDHAAPLELGFTEEEIQQTTFYEPVGCKKCRLGYRGRIAIHEAFYFTKAIRQLVYQSSKDIDEDALRTQAIKDGMLTLRASGRERIRKGLTTLEEIAFATAED